MEVWEKRSGRSHAASQGQEVRPAQRRTGTRGARREQKHECRRGGGRSGRHACWRPGRVGRSSAEGVLRVLEEVLRSVETPSACNGPGSKRKTQKGLFLPRSSKKLPNPPISRELSLTFRPSCGSSLRACSRSAARPPPSRPLRAPRRCRSHRPPGRASGWAGWTRPLRMTIRSANRKAPG